MDYKLFCIIFPKNIIVLECTPRVWNTFQTFEKLCNFLRNYRRIHYFRKFVNAFFYSRILACHNFGVEENQRKFIETRDLFLSWYSEILASQKIGVNLKEKKPRFNSFLVFMWCSVICLNMNLLFKWPENVLKTFHEFWKSDSHP